MNRKPRPLKVISKLSKQEQWEIYRLLQSQTYKDVAALIKERHGEDVSENTLTRHYRRCAEQETMEELPEIKESADAWNAFKDQALVTRFDEAALERLKLRAFQLSGTLKNQKEFTQLKGLFQILFAARNTEVRERTIANRERNTIIRENESWERIQWMRHRRTTAQNKPTPSTAGPVSAPGASQSEAGSAEELERVARVFRTCGGANEFFCHLLPGERVTVALRRIHNEIENGTFRPLAPGEPPRFRVVPKEDTPSPDPENSSDASSESLSNASPVESGRVPCSAGILPAGSEASSLVPGSDAIPEAHPQPCP